MMKRYIALLVIAALAAIASPISAAQTIYKNNVRIAGHEHIQGTHVWIVPPSGAVVSSSFYGFETASGITIECSDETAPLSAMLSAYSAEALASRGIELKDRSDVMLNGREGALLIGKDEEGRGAMILLITGISTNASVRATYPPSYEMTARNALLSAVFDDGTGAGAPAKGIYSIDTAGTKLKFLGESNYVRSYRGDDEAVTLEVSIVPLRSEDDATQAYTDELFEQFVVGREPREMRVYASSAGGLNGFVHTAVIDGVRRRVRTSSGGTIRRTTPGGAFHAVLFDTRGSSPRMFVFKGLALHDADANMQAFSRVLSTFTISR